MLGKVPIGPRAIKKLGRALLLGLDEIEDFIGEAKARRRRSRHLSLLGAGEKVKHDAIRAPDYEDIQADTFRIISDWYHFAILEVIQLKESRSDIEWISLFDDQQLKSQIRPPLSVEEKRS